MATRISKYKSGPVPALTANDLAAGITMGVDRDGKPKLCFPPPELSSFHRNHKTNFCRRCKLHLAECQCEKPNRYPRSEPKYEGMMTLPESHPDHPCHKSA